MGQPVKLASIGEAREEISLQPASLDIWDSKYRLKTKKGDILDQEVHDTYARVARTLAEVEPEAIRSKWYESFLWALSHGAVPAGRIVSNAGAQEHKPATSTINCTVSGTVGDSMNSILEMAHEAGLTLKAGCGIGYEFSTLRPRGAYVAGAGAYTSGPLSFMDIYDKVCFTVSSAGGRRGAQMGTFDVGHPDVKEFITAKREDGRLRQFNLSLMITDEFMQAVEAGRDWVLAFPLDPSEAEEDSFDLNDTGGVVWREWPTTRGYISDHEGRVACKVYGTLPAHELFDLIMRSTYEFAEPGFILIDRVNEMNNNWYVENIRATNPCGELSEILRKRRHGMGFLGLGSTLAMLRIRYGSEQSTEFTERVARELALTGWRAGLELSREKGPAPIMDEEFEVTPQMLRQRPEMAEDGIKAGDKLPGRVLMARYSRYMQRVAGEDPELVEAIAAEGARFTHHSSIAPTGTISLSLGNNASNGVEPSFAHHYFRNVIREGRKTKEKVPVYSYELLAYRERINPDANPEGEGGQALPDYFVTADDVSPAEHVAIQSAAQKWVDSSISKTANVPSDYPYERFKDIYVKAWKSGLKGCTTFRFNPAAFQGVLVKEKDLKSTFYVFQLEDGTEVRFAGDEEVEYDGQVHTAANLFDALKEGYYGKF